MCSAHPRRLVRQCHIAARRLDRRSAAEDSPPALTADTSKMKAGHSARFCYAATQRSQSLLSFLQAPQHIIKLIETAIADRQNATALALVDAHGKTKRVRYAFFQCDQIGVLVAAA